MFSCFMTPSKKYLSFNPKMGDLDALWTSITPNILLFFRKELKDIKKLLDNSWIELYASLFFKVLTRFLLLPCITVGAG